MSRKIVLFAVLAIGVQCYGQTGALPVTSCVTVGGTQARVSGLSSTNYQMGVIPSCTVTVYLTGTNTVATSTPQSPFTANTDGSIPPIYAATGGYDVVLSGGICPNCYSAPVTFTDVYSLAINGGALTVSQITATANPGYIGSEQETTTNTAPENTKITHLDFSPPAAVVPANGATGTATAVTAKFTDLGTFTCPNTSPATNALGDAVIQLRVLNGTLTHVDNIKIVQLGVYTDSGGAPGTLLTSLTVGKALSAVLGNLQASSTYQTTLPPTGNYSYYPEYLTGLPLGLVTPGGGPYTCPTPGATLHLVMNVPVLPVGDTLEYNSASVTGQGYTSPDGVVWTGPTNMAGSFYIRGQDVPQINARVTNNFVAQLLGLEFVGLNVFGINNNAINAVCSNVICIYANNPHAQSYGANSIDGPYNYTGNNLAGGNYFGQQFDTAAAPLTEQANSFGIQQSRSYTNGVFADNNTQILTADSSAYAWTINGSWSVGTVACAGPVINVTPWTYCGTLTQASTGATATLVKNNTTSLSVIAVTGTPATGASSWTIGANTFTQTSFTGPVSAAPQFGSVFQGTTRFQVAVGLGGNTSQSSYIFDQAYASATNTHNVSCRVAGVEYCGISPLGFFGNGLTFETGATPNSVRLTGTNNGLSNTGTLVCPWLGATWTAGDFVGVNSTGDCYDTGVNAAASGTTIHGTPTANHLTTWYSPTVLQDGGLVPHGILVGACSGTVTSNATITLSLGQYGSFGCTSTATGNQVPIGAHTIENLHVYAATASGTAGSGVVVVTKNGVATAIACILSTSQSCEDLTHSVAFSDGDRVMITAQSTASSGDTLATITASVEVY